ISLMPCFLQVGHLLCPDIRLLDHDLPAINQRAIRDDRGHDRLVLRQAFLHMVPGFLPPPDVGAPIMMGIRPIQTENLASPSTVRLRYRGPMPRQQGLCIPARLKDRGMHGPPAGFPPLALDLEIIDPLQRLMGTQDKACHITANMLKPLITASQEGPCDETP